MRHSKYSKKHERIMFELKIKGINNKIICEALGIDERTFYRWIKEKQNFKKLYIKAVNAKTNAIKALIKKAIGFTEYIEKPTAKGNVVKYNEYFPPDFQSIKYLLRNISDFDKELEENIDNNRFDKWFTSHEKEIHEKIRKIYESDIIQEKSRRNK